MLVPELLMPEREMSADLTRRDLRGGRPRVVAGTKMNYDNYAQVLPMDEWREHDDEYIDSYDAAAAETDEETVRFQGRLNPGRLATVQRSYVTIPRRVHGDTSYTIRPEHQLPSRKSSAHREGSTGPLVSLATLLNVVHERRKEFTINHPGIFARESIEPRMSRNHPNGQCKQRKFKRTKPRTFANPDANDFRKKKIQRTREDSLPLAHLRRSIDEEHYVCKVDLQRCARKSRPRLKTNEYASCSHRVPRAVLMGNVAAKGSAINGMGSRHEPTSIERTSLAKTKLVDEARRGDIGNTRRMDEVEQEKQEEEEEEE
ncbi:Uncharacterized protein DBV15_00102, partial [Temnothorax longispinosus]